MLAVVNIVVRTRSSDSYKRVALNQYPIVIRTESLVDALGSAQLKDWVNTVIISRETYESARFCIRVIESSEGGSFRDLEIPVSRHIEYLTQK